MSIEAKNLLIKKISEQLSDKMTEKELMSTIGDVEKVLTSFVVEKGQNEIDGGAYEEMLSAFISTKLVEGRAESTVKHYKFVLGKFFESVQLPIHDVSVYTLRSYLAKRKADGVKDATLENERSVLSAFFGWLHKEGLLPVNPCENLMPIKCRKEVRKPYSKTDIELIKECCGSLRDRAIVSFLLSTGCRIGEVSALNRNSVDFDRMECVVLGKGDKERVVFFDEVTAMILKKYLDSRTDEYEALFLSKRKTRLSPSGVWKMLKEVSKRANVENVHPHRFRRTMATNLIDHGMQIQEVASILGHSKLDTTMKYVYINKTNLKNDYYRHM